MIHDALRAAMYLQKEAASPAEVAALLVGGALIGSGITHAVRGNAQRNGVLENIKQVQYQSAMSDWNNKIQEQQAENLRNMGQTPGMGVLKAAANNQFIMKNKPLNTNLGSLEPGSDGSKSVFKGVSSGGGSKGGGIKVMGNLLKAPDKASGRRQADVPQAQKISADNTTAIMAGAGLGGLGGYLAGAHLVAPKLEQVAAKAAAGAKAAPIGGAVVGALLLAAMVALYKNRDSLPSFKRKVPYDPAGEGYAPQNRVPFGGPPRGY